MAPFFKIVLLFLGFQIPWAIEDEISVRSEVCPAGAPCGRALLQSPRRISRVGKLTASLLDLRRKSRREQCALSALDASVKASQVPVDSMGFESVKQLCCPPIMQEFIRRVIREHWMLDVCQEGPLSGFTLGYYCNEGQEYGNWTNLLEDTGPGSDARDGNCSWIGLPPNCPAPVHCLIWSDETPPCQETTAGPTTTITTTITTTTSTIETTVGPSSTIETTAGTTTIETTAGPTTITTTTITTGTTAGPTSTIETTAGTTTTTTTTIAIETTAGPTTIIETTAGPTTITGTTIATAISTSTAGPTTTVTTSSAGNYLCIWPNGTIDYSLISFGDAAVGAHAIYKKMAIGGTLSDASKGENGVVNGHVTAVKVDNLSDFNFNGGYTVGVDLSTSFDWSHFAYLAEHVIEADPAALGGDYRVCVFNTGGTYNMDDCRPGGQGEDNGKTLFVFNTADDITLVGTPTGRQFGPSVLAPFSRVFLDEKAGYIDGCLIANSLVSVGPNNGQLQMHGDCYTGPLICS